MMPVSGNSVVVITRQCPSEKDQILTPGLILEKVPPVFSILIETAVLAGYSPVALWNSNPTSVACTLGRAGRFCISKITGTTKRTTIETSPTPRMGLVVMRIAAPKNPRTPRCILKSNSTGTVPIGGSSKLLVLKLIQSLHEDSFDTSKP